MKKMMRELKKINNKIMSKKIQLLLATLLLSTICQATIYRLNYTGPQIAGKDYTGINFGLLHNAASNGDTVQIYSNTTNDTTNVILSKRLVIIGFGYNLNTNSGLQAVSFVDTNKNALLVECNAGSAGSVIEGVNIRNCIISDSNITVRRCRIGAKGAIGQIEIGAFDRHLKNISIQGCYFKNYVDTMLAYSPTTYQVGRIRVWGLPNAFNFTNTFTVQNLKITNNIIEGFINMESAAGSTGVIANNVIVQKAGGMWFPSPLVEMQYDYGSYLIKNNILYYDSTKYFTTVGAHYWPFKLYINSHSIFVNNISNMPSSINQGIASNIFGVNGATLFATGFNKGWYTSETSLQLALGSAALNAGINNAGAATNCGIYGGEPSEIYKLSGVPDVPSIFVNTVPSTSTTNPTTITISTRTNN